MPDYPILDTVPRIQYIAASNQTVFSYGWPIFAATDLKVYLTGAGSEPSDVDDILVLNANYTVSGVGDENGGNITLTAPASANDIITIQRLLPVERHIDYINGNAINANALNEDFDRIIMMIQDVNVYLYQLIAKYQTTATIVPNELVLPILPPNYVWQGGPNNTVIAVTNDCEDDGCSTLRSELANATQGGGAGAYIVGYYDEQLGSTTVGDELDKLNTVVNNTLLSILQFGATNDGLTDTTPALNAAYNYCSLNQVRILTFPAGDYLFETQPDKAPLGMRILGAGTGITTILRDFNASGSDAIFESEDVGLSVVGFSAVAEAGTTGGAFIKVAATNNDIYEAVEIDNIYIGYDEVSSKFDYGIVIAGASDFFIAGVLIDNVGTINTGIAGISLFSVFAGNVRANLEDGLTGTGDFIVNGTAATPSKELSITLTEVRNMFLDRVTDSIFTVNLLGDVTASLANSLRNVFYGTSDTASVRNKGPIYIQNIDFVGDVSGTESYQTLPNGLILQQMLVVVLPGAPQAFTLPTPFKVVNQGVVGLAYVASPGVDSVFNPANSLTTVTLAHGGLINIEVNIMVWGY